MVVLGLKVETCYKHKRKTTPIHTHTHQRSVKFLSTQFSNDLHLLYFNLDPEAQFRFIYSFPF